MNNKYLYILTVLIICFSVKANDPLKENFLQWFIEQGGTINKIDIHSFENQGRGIIATDNIKAGETIVTIPSSLYITTEKVEKSLPPNFNNEPLVHKFALYILSELKSGKSFYKPYLELLPRNITTTLFFNDDEIEELQESPLKGLSIRRNMAVLRNYEDIFHSDIDTHIVADHIKNVTLDEFKWAISICWSRSFKLPSPYNSGFVPFADLFNMLHPSSRKMIRQKFENGNFNYIALRDIEKGEQIYSFYSTKGLSNEQILMDYGFVFDDNPMDFVPIGSPINEDIEFAREKLFIAEHAGCDDYEFFITKYSGVEKYLCALQISMLTEEDLLNEDIQKVLVQSDKLSLLSKYSNRVLKKAFETFKSLYTSYGTTFEEDEKILQDPNLSLNKRNAIKVRLSEKDILLVSMGYISELRKSKKHQL